MIPRSSMMFAALLLPSALAAQEIVFSPDATMICVEDGGGQECIGLSADVCMQQTEGGYSTVGMNVCLEEERAWWDGQLNDIYKIAITMKRAQDSERFDPNQPSSEEALREMQRNWIAFRDSTCDFEMLDWWGGTGATGAGLGCLMRLTGVQTLYLRSMTYGY
jgi:uncharacterized protein YecT (DUF1311 family)